MIIASIMTGTSVDGVDISIRDFNFNKNIYFDSFDFSQSESEYIKRFLWPNQKNMAEISAFNFKFSEIVGKYFNKLSKDVKDKINYVVFHGQTTFHDPNTQLSSFRSTMQLGNGAMLASTIQKNVICDLRSSDVSNQGQGAPLVIYGDKELFWDGKSQTLIFNIGGISNVSIIEEDGSIKGYDLGMGNAILDILVSKWFDAPYDKDSLYAKKGKINHEFLSLLKQNDEFISLKPPKATGKEYYNYDFIKKMSINNFNKNDILHTTTKYIAETIASVKNFEKISSDAKFIIAGGGAFNPLVMKYIKEHFPNIELSSKYNISIQEREAASFSVLGHYYLTNQKIGQTTGSKKMSIPGALYKYEE